MLAIFLRPKYVNSLTAINLLCIVTNYQCIVYVLDTNIISPLKGLTLIFQSTWPNAQTSATIYLTFELYTSQ